MINTYDILETIRMIQDECLDIRTTTMGISLLDCGDSDIDKSCQKVYDKICKKAENLVKTGEDIEKEYGIPIINKRVSVTPISILAGISGGDPVKYALTLEKAAKTIGVNFIGGYSALVQKGFAAGDRELIESIPQALAQTEHLCSSVNIGSTKAGINMDAVRLMGQKVKEAAELTKDNDCIGAGKLVVFCNAEPLVDFIGNLSHSLVKVSTGTRFPRVKPPMYSHILLVHLSDKRLVGAPKQLRDTVALADIREQINQRGVNLVVHRERLRCVRSALDCDCAVVVCGA